jgi:hypothetical protein
MDERFGQRLYTRVIYLSLILGASIFILERIVNVNLFLTFAVPLVFSAAVFYWVKPRFSSLHLMCACVALVATAWVVREFHSLDAAYVVFGLSSLFFVAALFGKQPRLKRHGDNLSDEP